MKSVLRTAAIAVVALTIGLSTSFAQKTKPAAAEPKAPAYSVASITVNAFSGSTSELRDALPETGEAPVFFNDLDTSLFVWVLIQGQAGTFEAGRMANVVVKEGNKIKMTRNIQIGIPNEQGFYTVPVFVYGPLCSEVTITAKITGQKLTPAKTVKVPFMCGE